MGKTERNDIEMYFEWWLNEAMAHGYVQSWTRESETFTLFPPFVAYKMKYLKTHEPTLENYNLLAGIKYNYDYRVIWEDKAKFIFFNPSDWSDKNNPPILLYEKTPFDAFLNLKENKWCSYVDVKPPAKAAQFSGSMNSFVTFPLKQKILVWHYGVYVNKVIPIPMSGSGKNVSLFPNTFTPRRFFQTDKTTQTRKIKFRIESFEKYVEKRKRFIDGIDRMVQSIRDKNTRQGDMFND